MLIQGQRHCLGGLYLTLMLKSGKGQTDRQTEKRKDNSYLKLWWIREGGTEWRYRIIAVHAEFVASVPVLGYDCKDVWEPDSIQQSIQQSRKVFQYSFLGYKDFEQEGRSLSNSV